MSEAYFTEVRPRRAAAEPLRRDAETFAGTSELTAAVATAAASARASLRAVQMGISDSLEPPKKLSYLCQSLRSGVGVKFGVNICAAVFAASTTPLRASGP